MRLQFRYILLVMTAGLFNATLALGATLTITPAGGGEFAVQGDNLNGVGGIELAIGYDTSVLTSPTVKWGSLVLGAVSMANPSTIPGTIKFVTLRTDQPFSMSGPIAAISFAKQSGSCGITSFSVKLIDMVGAILPAEANIVSDASCKSTAGPGLISTAGIPFSQTTATGGPPTTAPAATASVASSQVPMGLGTITLPGDTQPRKDEKPAESASVIPPEPAGTAEAVTRQAKLPPPEKTAEESESAGIKETRFGSVLDRFRTYQGEKTPDIVIALFTKEVSSSIHQVPSVITSDGKAPVRVSVDHSSIKGTSTNFALNGAKLVSLKKEDDNGGRWILEILPHADSLRASVTILNSSSMIDFPLTVVPPAGAVTGTKADFAAFLKDSGVQTPKYDLNGDGRHDYLDDFIYTAHYLIRSNAAAKNIK